MKPCPFCGEEGAYIHQLTGNVFSVVCECGVNGPADLGKSGAEEAWDDRPIENELLTACKKAKALIEEPAEYDAQRWDEVEAILQSAIERAKP